MAGRPGDRTFFIYDHTVVQREEDDPKDAIVYFYPHSINTDTKCLFCGQLMGMVNLMKTLAGSSPQLYRLKKLKIATKHEEHFTMALAGKQRTPDAAVIEKLERLYSVFAYYHGSLLKVLKDCGNKRNVFLKKMDAIWDCYLPFIRRYGNTVPAMLEPIPRVLLPKSASLLFLRCSHILQWLRSKARLLAGCILYKNSVLCSQLSPKLTSHLLLIRPNQSHLPSKMVPVQYNLPYGVRIMSVYLTQNEYRLLIKHSKKMPAQLSSSNNRKENCLSNQAACPSHNIQDNYQVCCDTTKGVLHPVDDIAVQSHSAETSRLLAGNPAMEITKDNIPPNNVKVVASGKVACSAQTLVEESRCCGEDIRTYKSLQSHSVETSGLLAGNPAMKITKNNIASKNVEASGKVACSTQTLVEESMCGDKDLMTNRPNDELKTENTMCQDDGQEHLLQSKYIAADTENLIGSSKHITFLNVPVESIEASIPRTTNLITDDLLHSDSIIDMRKSQVCKKQQLDSCERLNSYTPLKTIELCEEEQQKVLAKAVDKDDNYMPEQTNDYSLDESKNTLTIYCDRTIINSTNTDENCTIDKDYSIMPCAKVDHVPKCSIDSANVRNDEGCFLNNVEGNVLTDTNIFVNSGISGNAIDSKSGMQNKEDKPVNKLTETDQGNGEVANGTIISKLVALENTQIVSYSNNVDESVVEGTSYTGHGDSVQWPCSGVISVDNVNERGEGLDHTRTEADTIHMEINGIGNSSHASGHTEIEKINVVDEELGNTSVHTDFENHVEDKNIANVSHTSGHTRTKNTHVIHKGISNAFHTYGHTEADKPHVEDKKTSNISHTSRHTEAEKTHMEDEEINNTSFISGHTETGRTHVEDTGISNTSEHTETEKTHTEDEGISNTSYTSGHTETEKTHMEDEGISSTSYTSGHTEAENTHVEDKRMRNTSRHTDNEKTHMEDERLSNAFHTFGLTQTKNTGVEDKGISNTPHLSEHKETEKTQVEDKEISNTSHLSGHAAIVKVKTHVEDKGKINTFEKRPRKDKRMGNAFQTSGKTKAKKKHVEDKEIGDTSHTIVEGMVNVSLYVQAHSDMVLLYLAENAFVQDQTALYQLWRSVLTELGELEPKLKECALHHTIPEESVYNFIQYDNFDRLVQSSLDNPVTPAQAEFCKTAHTLHHKFSTDDSVTDITVRNHRATVYAHRNVSHQTYVQNKHSPTTSTGIPIHDDMAFFLDASAQKLLYKDHGINIL